MIDPKDLKQAKTEIENAIDMFENASRTQMHQWLTTTDLLCVLYLLRSLEMRLDALPSPSEPASPLP